MRLFVGIDLPAAVKDQLVQLQGGIPAARWTTRQQMHLTLFFLGETDRMQEIGAALAALQVAPFELTLAGVGRFPQNPRRPPTVLWAGIQEQPALARLHQQVTAALVGLGFTAESRPFSPHVTLARLGDRVPRPAVDAFLQDHRAFRIEAIPIHEFVLFSSVLRPEGARYTREAVYPLRA